VQHCAEGPDAGDGQREWDGLGDGDGFLVHAGQPEHDELPRLCLGRLGIQHEGAGGAGLVPDLADADGLWQGHPWAPSSHLFQVGSVPQGAVSEKLAAKPLDFQGNLC
jgi:hypothetical protein